MVGMEEIFELLRPYLPEIITMASSLLVAVLSLLYTKLRNRKTDLILQQLLDSDLAGLYVRCPYCGSKIDLAKAEIGKEIKSEKKTIEESK